MKKLFLAIIFSTASFAAHADVNVFACEPHWGALAKEIGGEHVKVTNATTALQDVHQLQARPSLMAAMRDAQLVICDGAELEAGWLPLLLRQAGSAGVQEGQAGNLMAAQHLQALEIPRVLDRSQGDLHAEGNPHFVTDPRNVRMIAKVLSQRLQAIDVANANMYAMQAQAFDVKFAAAIARWQKKAAPLKGMRIVVRHNVWVYMANWLDVEVVASLEPKPGVPPTSAHLAQLMETLQQSPARAIVTAAYEDPKPAQWLSEKSGLKSITLPYTIGGNDKAVDLFSLYESTLDQLLEAR